MEIEIRPMPDPSPDLDRWCRIYATGRHADSGSAEDAVALAARITADPEDPDVVRLGAWSGTELIGVAESRHNTTDEGRAPADGCRSPNAGVDPGMGTCPYRRPVGQRRDR